MTEKNNVMFSFIDINLPNKHSLLRNHFLLHLNSILNQHESIVILLLDVRTDIITVISS